MRKKHPRHVNHERWLVSYADFITLLFAFFVVMFATTQSDKQKKVELATSIQAAFSQIGLFEPKSSQPRLAPRIAPEAVSMAAVQQLPIALNDTAWLNLQRRIEESAQGEIASGLLSVHQSSEGLVVSLEEAGFFTSGAVDIRSSAVPVVDRIAALLPDSPLRVEGHTDNVPIHTTQFASNWELSSSRASSVARLLLEHANLHAEQMSVAGYAEYHPAASNATVEGRARNRRVDIVVLRNTGQPIFLPSFYR